MTALTNVELLAVMADHRPVPTPVAEAGVRFAFYGVPPGKSSLL